ncbi:MAG: DegT/DnrJ/EryC1/StrS family aminotransferase [Desulfobacterales bacterium]|nr:DegT/DnrJ/EryC1/StrS family aminotransferase [Desulfobacterales bacterium]
MKVPLLDLKPQLAELRHEILEHVTNVIDSTRYIQGPEVEALEKEISHYCSVPEGVGVSSGTDALLVALMALDLKPGDLVLTTPFSFFATMGIILRVGAKPAFADINPDTFNIDPEHVDTILELDRERKIKAIIPVHLYGQCADMEKITSIARRYNIPIIEDAAQAIGAEVPMISNGTEKWHKAGSMGLAGCFSFFPSKNLGAMGDGGMVISQNSSFAKKMRLMRNHGAHPKYYHAIVGGNFRLDPIQAVVLRLKLKHLEKWHQARRRNAKRYETLFAEADLAQNSSIRLPQAVYKKRAHGDRSRNYHIYNQYVIRAKRRDELRAWLGRKNVATEIYYPLCLHQQECVKEVINIPTLPHAEKAATDTLALPIYPELTLEMQEYVVKSIADFYLQE